MFVEDVRLLYAYNHWAMERLFTALLKLNESVLTRPLGGSFPTIRETLYHIVAAEWLWLQRWYGISPNELPDPSQLFNVIKLESFWNATDTRRMTYLNSLTDSQLRLNVAYRNLSLEKFSLPLGQLLLHCANHSTYHRGQITTMLRQSGATPVPLDMLNFFLESQNSAAYPFATGNRP